MLNYLLRNLKGTDWGMLIEFVSPAFFEVVPALGMAKVFGRILKDYSDAREFARVKNGVSTTVLPRVNLTGKPSIKLISHPVNGLPAQKLKGKKRKEFGQLVLRIYFTQLFSDEKSLLDIRSSSFDGLSGWGPAPVFYEWSPEFRVALCDLYRGFYQDDDIMYRRGLSALNLQHADEIFRGHFGTGNQDAVTFSLQHLKDSLHGVFASCIENKSRLHPDFFALGVYLLCLYENLETLGESLDVRSAFCEATEH